MSLFRIVHARGAIPNDVGPARCRATPALTSQPTRPAPLREHVVKSDESPIRRNPI